MNRIPVFLTAMVAAACLLAAGCSQPAPAPTQPPAKAAEPTKAPVAATAAPTKAAEPTKPAAAAQPTAAPAKKVDFPQKGRPITIMVPWAAGSSNDVTMRLLAAPLEKALGVPVQVENKPGASTQIGLTDLAKAKPDGYYIGNTAAPATQLTYMDPERKTAYGRKDFQPLAVAVVEPQAIYVRADSPYKSVKDLVDAAKANPASIKVGDNGYLSTAHMVTIGLEREGKVKFAPVHFDGAAPNVAALTGGHIDATVSALGGGVGLVKSGELRVIANTGREESKFIPGVKSIVDQGYNVVMLVSRGLAAPAGTPMEVVDLLATEIKKAVDSDDFKKKMDDSMLSAQFVGTKEYGTLWDETDAYVKVMLDAAKADATK